MCVCDDGAVAGEVKEWSPGHDVLEGTQPKVGEQRFSVQSKSAKRISFDQACWFPVTVRYFTLCFASAGQ